MNRTKNTYIRSWKRALDVSPVRASRMSDDAWYNSMLGLAFRMYFSHLMTLDELRAEAGI